MTQKILVVEDAQTLRDVVTTLLEKLGYAVDAFGRAEEALTALRGNTYCCVLSDFKLPGKNGLDLLRATRELSISTPFIIMTAYGSIEIAVEAMKLGANDFICKPFEPDTLSGVIADVIQHRRIVDRSLGTSTRRERSFLSTDPQVQRLIADARKVARVDSSVLILGESGTGKELVARYIHEQSPRREKPFVAINCAAIPAELLESDLFGHEAGAFTGATQTRTGLFEIASEGTLFLDEIGDMPVHLQVKLLRALQEREIKRVGSSRAIKVNPRIISATSVDLDRARDEGKMREDFYYRLAVITLKVPPLRERPSDVQMLADYFIEYFCTKLGRELLPINAGARELLLKHRWPGNARELENVIERAVILAESEIQERHLGIDLSPSFDALSDAAVSLTEIGQQAARRAEREAIEQVLRQTSNNKSHAARILGVSYKTLLSKVKDYGLQSENEGDRMKQLP